MNHDVSLSEQQRGWISLGIVLHFFILGVCLIQNNGASFLLRRLHQLTAPYSVAVHQDYGARALELSSQETRCQPHLLQIRSHATAEWEIFRPTQPGWLESIDSRWQNFEHMLAVAASENNEELIYLVFEKVVQQSHSRSLSVDGVRLLRPSILSFEQERLYRAGQLPAKDLEDQVLFEARVVSLPDSTIRLMPVLEPMRRATSVEPSR